MSTEQMRAEPVAWADPLDIAEERDFYACHHKSWHKDLRYTMPLYSHPPASLHQERITKLRQALQRAEVALEAAWCFAGAADARAALKESDHG